VLRIARDSIDVQTRTWDGRGFVISGAETFSRGDAGWTGG